MTTGHLHHYFRRPTGEMIFDEWIMVCISRGLGPTECFRRMPLEIPASYTGFLRRFEVLRTRFRHIP